MDISYNDPTETEEMDRSRRKILRLFGRNLQRERKAKGLTQEDLGSSAGVSDKYIGELERAEKNPSIHIVVCLARALKVDPCRLLGLAHSSLGSEIVAEDKCSLVKFIEEQSEMVLRDIVRLLRTLKGQGVK